MTGELVTSDGGNVIPPKTRPCPNCKGFGRVRDSMHLGTLPCGRCDGKGVIPE